ncbi:putative RNA-binding protein 19, partial [Ictidomys tridecemlineatus]
MLKGGTLRTVAVTAGVTIALSHAGGILQVLWGPNKARAWSKHAQRPRQPEQPSQGSVPPEIKKDDKKKKAPRELEQLKEDTEFQKFLSVHQKRTQVATWANGALDTEPPEGKSKPASDYLNFDSDSGQENEEEAARRS